MKRNLNLMLVIFLVPLLVFGNSIAIFGASTTPSEIGGNDPVISGYQTLKVDPPTSGNYNSGPFQVNVEFSQDKKWVDWSSSIPVAYVFVKAGNKGYLYEYSPAVNGDTELRAPDNNGGNQPEISHVTFYYQVTGSITIEKIVEDEEGNVINDSTEFAITITGPNSYEDEVLLVGNDSETVSNLPLGAYQFSENAPAGYVLKQITQSIILSEGMLSGNVTVINTKLDEVEDPTGSITIIKELYDYDETLIEEDQTEFTVQVTGPNGYDETFTFSVDELVLIEDLELGEYTITEINIPEGYTFEYMDPSDGILELTVQNLEAEITITNMVEFDASPTGSITINKGLYNYDESIIEEDETEFTVQITGPNGYDETFTFSVNSSTTIEDLELGEYTITEIDIPEGYTFEYMDPSDGIVNLNIEELEQEVTIYNMVKYEEEEETGSLQIIKRIGSSAGPFQAGVTFNITITEGSPISGVTDSNGEILFEGLEPGQYLVQEIVPSGYTTNLAANHTVTVVANEVTIVNVINSVIVIDDDPPIVIIDDDPIPQTPPTTPPVVIVITNEEEAADIDEEIEEIIEEDEIPLAIVEIILEEEEEEVDIILDEDIPLASSLPQTGEASPLLLYGLGALIATLGFGIKKRK